ncbi:hypothetical protein L873DRAFT_1796619 [Choiromyces venosus 120613-1]|uniref:DNA-directed DNA polymerase n=1 Tax=Choiromyces venosus 120613-1 TaxID=1336337 RepID=A0A3N4J3N0_9PEZI|nr:hypothetical protein L873DRAFT_1796619 [Choiromyces venosus 120613-1]
MSLCGNPNYEVDETQYLSNLFTDISPLCGTPDYSRVKHINNYHKWLPKYKTIDFKKAYSALNVKFNLPNNILYPSIPVSLDKNITIYPLSGETTITGLEYLSAKNILNEALKTIPEDKKGNYYIEVKQGVVIPFKTKIVEKEEILDYKPFYNVINELQANRRMHPKKTAMERIYKDLGNMLYGKVVCGISNKRFFDARTYLMKPMTGNELSNPIIAA